ncbi:hypothetical protein A6J59_008315 [Pasteurella multocida]|nr:hypothetical protein A0R69_09025 [Pasteurella multocida subsp. multocida]PNM10651.1 hypothetical protein A6J59_008315 [Pasteurella multocida]
MRNPLLFFVIVYVAAAIVSYLCFNYEPKGKYQPLKLVIARCFGVLGWLVCLAIVLYIILAIFSLFFL